MTLQDTPAWLAGIQALNWGEAGQILLAALLGGMIGFEREWQGRSAGLRTNIMIAIAACLFTILSITAFPVKGSAQDTARIAAQIVSGVGFIGAGTLIQTRNKVKGLTTAATIWLVAAIGMGVGAGAYFISIFTAVLATLILQLLRPLSHQIHHHQDVTDDKKKRKGSNDS